MFKSKLPTAKWLCGLYMGTKLLPHIYQVRVWVWIIPEGRPDEHAYAVSVHTHPHTYTHTHTDMCIMFSVKNTILPSGDANCTPLAIILTGQGFTILNMQPTDTTDKHIHEDWLKYNNVLTLTIRSMPQKALTA